MRLKNRIFGLDLMRASAIIGVLVLHFGYLGRPDSPSMPWMVSSSVVGVELFFVLSGYLVGKLFIDQIWDRSEISFEVVRRFWLRRWMRTLPNYYLFLLIEVLLTAFFFHSKIPPIPQFLVFLQSFSSPMSGFYPVSWTLSVEEWFYLLMPFLAWGLVKAFRSPRRSLYLAIVMMVAFSMILRNTLPISEGWDEGLRKTVIFRLDSVMIGVAVAILQRTLPELCRHADEIFWAGILGLIATQVWFVFYLFPDTSRFMTFSGRNLFFPGLDLACGLLLPKLSILSFNPQGQLLRGFRKWIERISKWSYSIYLCHVPILILTSDFFIHQHPKLFGLLIPFLMVSTLAVSALIYTYFEKPFLNLRDRWIPEREERSPLVAPCLG